MKRRTIRRLKNIALGAIASSCFFGFVVLLVHQPKQIDKAMLLGFGFGVCWMVRLTED